MILHVSLRLVTSFQAVKRAGIADDTEAASFAIRQSETILARSAMVGKAIVVWKARAEADRRNRQKKSWLRIASKPAQWTSCSYVDLVPIVVMMTVVAVNPMAVVPVVRGARVIAIVPIWSVVSIRIIAVSVTRIANSDGNLSVRTLRGDESQSTCHQCN